MTNNPSTGVAAVLIGVMMIAGAGAAGCGAAGGGRTDREGDAMTATEDLPVAEKSGTGELRTDPEPLTERFSALAGPGEVRWMSGTYGDPRAPGPSTYWIDAVVSLDPHQMTALVDSYAPAPTSEAPAVVDGMREHLPPGPFLTGDALSAAFAEGRWGARAFVDPEAGALVLIAIGT